jgi:hypothetical protein
MEALAMNPKAKTGVENHKAGELSGPLNFQPWRIGEVGGGALCTASFLGTPLYKPGGYLLLSDSVLLIYNYQAGIAVSCPTRLFLHQHLHSMHATEMYAPIKCNHAYVQMPQTP